MKERRKTGGKRPAHLEKKGRKRPVHAELSTRKPREAAVKPKVERGAVNDELLRALKAWFAGRHGGEQSADDALSAAAKAGRWELKGQLDRVFRHYARLAWLIRRQDVEPNGEWLWAAASVVLDRAPLEEVARRIAVTAADISKFAGKLGRMGNEGITHEAMPNPVRAEVPEKIHGILSEAYGAELTAELKALNHSAPLDIRVNTLKGDVAGLMAALNTGDTEVAPTPYAPLGLRAKGKPDLAVTEVFTAGRFDMQDEGSQLVAALADARPGQQVLDFCAGAGGKSLALAAAMGNKGHLVAADTSAKRLARAKLRLKRAGVENAERILLTGTDDDPYFRRKAAQFDRVLVDAPCSGTGAWRRHPEAKWGTEIDLERLTALQDAILTRAAKMLKRGGKLTYATCSILPQENQQRVAAFLAAHPGFRQVPVAEVWAQVVPGAPYPGRETATLQLTPFRHGTDGFFAAVFERVS
ncbi:MAG: RsmB/NOP family class I SAM-dependent RNA methyltransferase [Micropepsaceae bacterium]